MIDRKHKTEIKAKNFCFDLRDQPSASANGPMVVDYLIAMFKSNEKDSIGPSYSPKTLVKWSRPPQQFFKNGSFSKVHIGAMKLDSLPKKAKFAITTASLALSLSVQLFWPF